MHAFDLSPLFRSTVGFDRLNQMLDAASKMDERTQPYPPYNITKTGEDEYQIVMAVAGFRKEDITITAQENVLTVSGAQSETLEDSGVAFLHRGIAQRNFERKFQLADHVKVKDASLEDGLLTLQLKREIPEESKPRTIAIHGGNGGAVSKESAKKRVA
ncbi:MAG: Hsp20 family protein [Alphaproteobacteria bacterium]|nr:Hsp20 family protein [Alphaproteobacteria bacterium]